MKKLNLLIISTLVACSIFGQQLVSFTPLASHSTSTVQAYMNGYGWNSSGMTLNPVKSYKVTYNTTDVHGNPTVASGAVYIPTLTNCDYAPILAYEHGTEFVRGDVPSNNEYIGRGLYFSTTGYITVMPDYLGLGDNPGIHLYQHSETEATATLDLVRAVREYLDTASNEINDNGQFFLTGYSHGGHAAMATNKYVEDNSLSNEFDVTACAPLSGAFDQSGAQFDLIFDGDSNYYASPFLPYILASYQEAYGDLYQNYNEVYDATHASQIQTYINAGTYTFAQWISLLGTNHYSFMQDTVLQAMKADLNRDSHPINRALKANDLYDWVPQNPIRMLYCGNDSMVSPENSINTLDTMLTLGATQVEAINVLPTGDHNSCFVPATTNALNWFDTFALKCINYASVDIIDSENISLYPNPTTSSLTIEGIELTNYFVTIHSSLGQLFKNNKIINNQIDVSELSQGVYIITISSKENTTIKRLKFIKE